MDTTCGSVLNVWKNVTRYAQDGFTAIHGKVKHEETRATASQALKYPRGRYLVVLDREEAALSVTSSGTVGDRRRSWPGSSRSGGLRPGDRSGPDRVRQPDHDADVGVAGHR